MSYTIRKLFANFAFMNRFIVCIIALLASLSLQAQNYVECEDTCSHIHGIDLSHYQGNVFWETIGTSKMAYVYLKASEGGSRIDSKYKQNIDLAHRYGLKVGSYHFYRPNIPQQTQLENFKTQCRPGDQDLIPMVDVETRSGLSVEAFQDSLFLFLHLMEKAYKQKPLIYTGANFYDHNLLGKLKDYKVIPILKDNLEYIMWQYTGKGHLNGINGYVDKSRFMGKHKLREIRFRHR